MPTLLGGSNVKPISAQCVAGRRGSVKGSLHAFLSPRSVHWASPVVPAGPQVSTGPWCLVSPQFKTAESYLGRNEEPGGPGLGSLEWGAGLGWQPAGLALSPRQPPF